MRKSTLFVSALLTMFLMATMFGVVSAYQQATSTASRFASQEPQSIASQSSDPASIPLPVAQAPAAVEMQQPPVVTPEEATTIAVDFLGDPNVFSVEVVDYQGAPTYLVTFSSGDLIYVNSTGQVVAAEKIQPVVVAASPNMTKNNGNQSNNNGGSNGGGNGGGEHEEHDDHDD